MAMIFPEKAVRACSMSDCDGVRPPSAMAEFSSILATPASAASRTSSIPPTHSSSIRVIPV